MPVLTAIAAGAALLVAFALTPAARELARRLGAVDRPGGRRVHLRETPRMGGLAVFAAYLTAVGAVWAYATASGASALGDAEPVLGFVLGGMVVTAVGVVDDIKALGAKKKLVGQILAATIAWAAGARIETFDIPYIGNFEFGPIASYLATVGWILAFVNAINLIDGLDGLASGIVLFAAITNTVVAFVTGNVLAAVLNAALGGAVLGFLYYNFNPATVFLGDTGSMFLGYCLGAAALLTGRQKESTVVALLVPLIALGVPLTDTLFTMVRRFLERRPIFSADRGHIHHRLLDLGLTHRRVVLFLYAGSVVTCAAALIAAFGKDWQAGAAIALAAVVILGGARFAGYFRATIRSTRANQFDDEVEAVRAALPLILASDAGSVFEDIERLVLNSRSFLAADLISETELMWQWGADVGPGPEDIEHVYAWQSGTQSFRLRFVLRGDGAGRSERLDALLQVVADRVATRAAERKQLSAANSPVVDRGAVAVGG